MGILALCRRRRQAVVRVLRESHPDVGCACEGVALTGAVESAYAVMSMTGLSEREVGRVGGDVRLSPDDLFHSLQNERRRRVLRAVMDADDEPLEMGAVAEAIAAAENECEE